MKKIIFIMSIMAIMNNSLHAGDIIITNNLSRPIRVKFPKKTYSIMAGEKFIHHSEKETSKNCMVIIPGFKEFKKTFNDGTYSISRIDSNYYINKEKMLNLEKAV